MRWSGAHWTEDSTGASEGHGAARWQTIDALPGEPPRTTAVSVFTGREILLWGGSELDGPGDGSGVSFVP